MANINVSVESIIDFLVGLLKTPSPTGYTSEAIEYVANAFTDNRAQSPLL